MKLRHRPLGVPQGGGVHGGHHNAPVGGLPGQLEAHAQAPAVTLSAAAGVPLVLASHKRAAHAYLNISKRILGQRVPLLRIR